MKKIVLIILALSLCAGGAMAQKKSAAKGGSSYQTIGIHGGYGWEISYQKGSDASRFELNLGLAGDGVSLTYVKQFVKPISEVQNLNWYWGYGALGYLGTEDFNIGFKEFAVGVVGDLGLEYRIQELPLTISLDWRPCVAVRMYSSDVTDTKFELWNDGIVGFIGLGVRYRF